MIPDFGVSLTILGPLVVFLLVPSNRGFETGLMTDIVWPRSLLMGGMEESTWFDSLRASSLAFSLAALMFKVREGRSIDWLRESLGEVCVGLWGGLAVMLMVRLVSFWSAVVVIVVKPVDMLMDLLTGVASSCWGPG